MPFIPVLKTLLLLVLLSVIPHRLAHAGEPAQVYRFGEWTLIAPAAIDAAALSGGLNAIEVPPAGLELIAYWQDGSQRAVAFRFHGSDPKQDVAIMKSFDRTHRLKSCRLSFGGGIKPMKKMLPKDVEPKPFPDDGAFLIRGGERGLRRSGDTLAADMSQARVQIAEDSPVVRLGEWDSADFCRFELTKTFLHYDDEE